MLCRHCDQFFDDEQELDEHLQQEQIRALLVWVRAYRKKQQTEKPPPSASEAA